METLESLYGLKKHEVQLTRVQTRSGRWLETFESPGREYSVEIAFPEFACLCPKTSQPDFATVTLFYRPKDLCVELKSLKYFLNSFRNEGHFHEAVCNLIADDLEEVLKPFYLVVTGAFNVRGGTYPKIIVERGDG